MGMEINTAKGGQQQAQAPGKEQSQTRKAPAAGFLDAFRKVPEGSFRKTGTGLKVATLQEGTGVPSTNGMKIKVRYTGWLEDGTKFDSSNDRGKPFEFTLGAGRVIKGWEEGLLGVRSGERRQLVIPAEQAYGNREVGSIPPGSTLVFNIEVISVSEASANTKGQMNVVA